MRREALGIVLFVAWLWACGGADAPSNAGPTEPELDDSAAEGSPLCPSCQQAADDLPGDFGGDTGDFGGLRAPCEGEAVGYTTITLEEASELGFDSEPLLEAAETRFEAPVRWGHSNRELDLTEPSNVTVEIRRTGSATLVDWEPRAEPPPGAVRCHDGDYVVPHVEVAVSSDDGMIDGSFLTNLGPDEHGVAQPQDGANGTTIQLFADASSLGGSLEFSVSPQAQTRLTVWLYALFDHPQVPPRVELSLVLDVDDGGGWSGVEGYGARPADDCGVRGVPQDEVVELQVPADAVDGPQDCRRYRGESDVVCCTLRDPDDPYDLPPSAYDED